MRSVLLTTLTLAAFSVAAQQQPQAPDQRKPAAGAKKDSNLERRLRTEGAAGGTAPVPEEQRKGVGAGAKPHLHDDRLDRGMHRRSDAEVISPAR
jgi:hypothetical protein